MPVSSELDFITVGNHNERCLSDCLHFSAGTFATHCWVAPYLTQNGQGECLIGPDFASRPHQDWVHLELPDPNHR